MAPIFDYGSGQPWNRRRGYDYNGDGKLGDRLPGVAEVQRGRSELRADEPAADLRPAHGLQGEKPISSLEFFNLFNRDNFDPNSLQVTEFLSGPTLANPAAAAVVNPRYKQYTATLTPFEAQIGRAGHVLACAGAGPRPGPRVPGLGLEAEA